MGKLKRIDLEKSTEGVWFDYYEGVRLKVAGWRNPKFQKALREKRRSRGAFSGALSEDDGERLLVEAMSEHILIGWDHLEGADEKPIPYSAESALAHLTDPELGLCEDVIALSKRDDEFEKAIRRNGEGN